MDILNETKVTQSRSVNKKIIYHLGNSKLSIYVWEFEAYDSKCHQAIYVRAN